MSDNTDDTEVSFKFHQLEERAKDRARNKYREGDNLDYDWYEHVYHDAVYMGKMLGIEVDTTSRTTKSGRTVQDINIYFSGFSSQGDGASFSGNYRFAPDAVRHITGETTDEELLRIAQELTIMQITQRLQGLEPFTAYIRSGTRGRDHSLSIDIRDHGTDEVGDPDEEQFTQLMDDFADWIYKQLETEYDYFMSDEYIDGELEHINDDYDEEGNVI